MGEALGFMPDINEAKTASHDVFELLDASPGIDPVTVPAGAVTDDGDGSIVFDDVHFAYPQRPDVPILQGLSFKVKKGQKVALVGPSGGGKSTVIALLERFYDPAKGSITIGGQHDLKRMNVSWWRQQIGYVGQEPVMFDLSLVENVKYGCSSSVTQSDLDSVAAASNMDFISGGSNNSLQWTSSLGPRGGLLSGGQKQRAAIARAQLRKPRIMLFDEATSALDSNSEKLVQAALERSMVGRTSFTIAHRLSTIVDSDLILVIAQGRLVEQGTHSELMQLRGTYYSQFMQGQGAS
jgi:ABC-type multidrug transport system fused ATPase/permease subunit